MKISVLRLILVKGAARAAFESRSNKAATKSWRQAVISASQHATKVKGPCKLLLRFLLPPDRYSPDYPYGPNAGQLAAVALDALNETIFSEVPGGADSIVWLEVIKLKTAKPSEAALEILVEQLPAAVVTKKGADAIYLPRRKV